MLWQKRSLSELNVLKFRPLRKYMVNSMTSVGPVIAVCMLLVMCVSREGAARLSLRGRLG